VLALQYTVLPVLAWVLALPLADPELRAGFVIVGAAPSEITSALMVFLAGGDAALATGAMALSVLVSPFVMPPILSLLAGHSVHMNVGEMFLNLAVIVAIPVLVGASLRTRFPKLGNHADECSALASLMVILLIFIVAAANAGSILQVGMIGTAVLLLVLNVSGYALGWLTGRIVAPRDDRRPFIFTVGMKEFGVATAVALNFFPGRAALPAAVYGVLMLITAPYLVRRLRTRERVAL
jgi:BASS family bile acid:Na+ symporter